MSRVWFSPALPVEALARLSAGDLLHLAARHLKSLGFGYIFLDLEGFRSGSLNAVLTAADLVPLSLPTQ